MIINFKVKNSDVIIPIFTTRANMIFGISYSVLASENDKLLKIVHQKINFN